ncbi:MAG: adenylate/guanylate cyclase domain-containing protein [Sulfuricella sp.]|nr:adenylate/guanylate cyclase domain-containing protein [Sulfuricella sp.]
MSWLLSFTRRSLVLAVAITLFSVLAAEVSYRAGWADLAENAYTDLWHRLAGVRHAPEHVVLVTLDDRALLEYRDDPLAFWTPHIAKASAVLRAAGVKIIGLDFLFAISPESWLRKLNLPDSELSRTYDIPFRNEINSGKLVMVGSRLVDPSLPADDFLLPHPDYLLAVPDFDFTAAIGLADLAADSDGLLRTFVPAPVIREDPQNAGQPLPRLTLGMLLAVRAGGQQPAAGQWRFGAQDLRSGDTPLSISYAGPPGTLPRISLSRLLAPNAAQDPAVRALHGKVAIIGGQFLGMDDLHSTPYSSGFFGKSGVLMTGPEVQGNIAETLLSGRFDLPVGAPQRLLYFLALIGLAALIYQRLTPWRGLLLLAGASALGGLVSFQLFRHYQLLPLAHLQIGLIAAYLGCYGLRLTGEERERARVTQIFGRYVSGDVVEMLLKAKNLPDLGGESRQVSILFSDIRNFTTISEKLAAHEVVEMLNTYLERACAAVLQEGGTIDKFIGDAVMAQFGSPVRHPDHALRAVRAALALERAAADFQGWMAERFAGRGLPEFHIGVGIHSGVAVIGNIGSRQRMEYTAIGDTVNTASRLEGVTKSLGCAIVVSRQTLEACGGAVLTGKTEAVHVKGREQAVEVFEVIGLKEETSDE